MAVEIPLTQGFVALVDEEDVGSILAAGSWYAHRPSRTRVYAMRNMRRSDGSRRPVSMHTFLTAWDFVDHENGNGLDNRRMNLRPASGSENGQNKGIQSNNTSGFKGVCWHKGARKWTASIKSDGRDRYLGLHLSADLAAMAYDEAARELFGEFARLNFPGPGERGVR